MAGPVVYGFDHIHIHCSDLAATERWFLEGIGAELIDHHDSFGTPVTTVRLGGARILLRPARPGERFDPAGPRCYGEDHFGLEVADLDATAAELKHRGVEFEVEPRDFGPGARIAFVRGPDSVRIELVQRLG